MVFNTTLGEDTESEEPTIRNSNLLPVNANGEVRFLSVASLSRSGRMATPVFKVPPCLEWVASPVLQSWSITSSSCSPRNMEMMAGGASCGAETVVVARNRRGLPQQIRVTVHRLHNAGQHQQELDVLVGSLARIQQIDAVVGGQRPVVVLSGTVDAGKRLLVKQAGQFRDGLQPSSVSP